MTAFELIEANGLNLHGDIEHFAELVRADERNRLATKLVQDFKGAFGDDTCASWAVWIKEQ